VNVAHGPVQEECIAAALSANRGKIRSSGQPLPRRTQSKEMTIVPTEIDAAAAKNSATDKHTPMMDGGLCAYGGKRNLR